MLPVEGNKQILEFFLCDKDITGGRDASIPASTCTMQQYFTVINYKQFNTQIVEPA